MIKSYKIRLFPTPEQEKTMRDSVNAARFVWNWGLAYQMERFKNGEKHLSAYDMKKVLTQIKKQDEFSWLNGVSAQTLSMALLDLGNTYDKFFALQKKGEKFSKAKIKRAARLNKKLTSYDMQGHPKFMKKAKAKPSFYVRYDRFYFSKDYAVLEKIGKVKYQTNYELPIVGKMAENTVKFTNPRVGYINDKWILSFGMEVAPALPAGRPARRTGGCENQAQELNDFAVGIDLGVKTLAVISYDNGKKKSFKNINKSKRVKKLKKRLKHYQREVSRKYEQHGNYEKTNRILETEKKINNIHRKLANIRLNHVHHVTTEIIGMLPKMIIMENLNVSGMMKNKHLSKAIQEQLFHEFMRQIEYKCKFNGIEFMQADRFYPSSKKCCKCGSIKQDLKLKDRLYKCNSCGIEIDRDENASENLEKLAV
jgi:putative transposase